MIDVDGLLERLNGLRETRTDDAIDVFEKRASLANCLPQIIATIEQQRAEIAHYQAAAEHQRSEAVRLRNFEIMLMRLLRKPDNEDLQAKARDLLQRLGTKNGILREDDPC